MNHMKKIFISEFAKILMECYKYLCASLLIFKTDRQNIKYFKIGDKTT